MIHFNYFKLWYKGTRYNSITLDEDTCAINYNGILDKTTRGVKPIAIMVEDFDKDGKVRSSVPVQFLVVVWMPRLTHMTRGSNGLGLFRYPPFFDTDEHDDYDEPIRIRRENDDHHDDDDDHDDDHADDDSHS